MSAASAASAARLDLGLTSDIDPADLEALFEHISEGLILAHPCGEVVHWNRAALRMHDLVSPSALRDPSAAFIADFDLYGLDGNRLAFEQWPLRRLLHTGALEDCELWVCRRSSEWRRRFAFGGSTLRGADGKPRLAVLRIADVTPQRDAEAMALRELERQTLLLDCAQILLSAHDVTAEIIHKLYDHVRGHLRADVLFHYRLPDPDGSLELVHGEGIPPRHREAFARLPMGAAFCGLVAQHRAPLTADVNRIACDQRSALLADMGVTAYACVPLLSSDDTLLGTLSFASTLRPSFGAEELRFLHTLSLLVSLAIERSMSRAALAAREERLRLVLEQLPVVVWNTDRALRVTYVGGTAFQATRSRDDGAIGRALDQGPNPEPPEVIARYRRALAGEQCPFERTVGDRVIRGLIGPLRDVRGDIAGVVGIASDVTEQVQAQREIERLNEDLERRVQERTAELRAANAELETFSYAVSHDLRAPLRAVAGFSQALREDYGAALDEDGRELLDMIIGAGATMTELIDALLALSRVTRCDLERDELDLSAIALTVIAELERAEPARAVRTFIEPGLRAHGDRRLVEALLRNLLGNAWKYSSKVAAAEVRVYAEADSASGARVFCISDNGAGFSMDFAAKLFKPFQRLHRQDEFPGTGVGLATVQRIVSRHGGTVTAHSKPGQGATFRFTLTAEEPAPAPRSTRPTRPPPMAG